MSGTRVHDIVRSAMAIPAERRGEYVVMRCGGDGELLRRVQQAVAAQESATIADGGGGSGGEDAFVSRAAEVASEAADGRFTRIGHYRILRELGEGGMGVVYLAEQDHPRRPVAIKVIRSGVLSPKLLRRFELESQVLGRLQHPGIAQVYEAGRAAGSGGGGVPFFAMEYVQGVPLTDYADAKGLNTRERLELLARVCDAVHHAHQKGVVHRDLKPGNILVDAAGQPKILDFGIARTLDSDIAAVTMQTDAGALIGTVPYMSPEQVAGDAQDVDTRSDVYTLGVILYELLAARLPHDVSSKTIPEAARTIAQENPTRLSVVNKGLRGDVETIVGKALEKDRNRRYQSASELAEDIRRYLRNEPIAARPPSRTYQVRKFAQRNKGLVGGLAVTFVVLVAASIVASSLAVIARRNEVRAEEEAATAKAVTEFLQRMLASADPEGDQRIDSAEAGERVATATTVREVLDRSAAGLDAGAMADRPPVQIALRETVMKSYAALGEYQEMEKQARAMLARVEGLGDPGLRQTARQNVASALLHQGRFDEAIALFKEAHAWYIAHRPAEDIERAECAMWLSRAQFEAGRPKEAMENLPEIVKVVRRVRGEKHPRTLQARDLYASVLTMLGKYPESEQELREILKVRQEVYGVDDPVTCYSMSALGNVLQKQDKNAEALPLLEHAYAIRQRVFPADHPRVLVTAANLAVAYVGLKRYEEAAPLLRMAYDKTRARLGDDHPRTRSAMGNLAFVLEDMGSLAEAEDLFRRAVENGRSQVGKTLQETEFWPHLNNLAMLLMKKGEYAEAEGYLKEAVERSKLRLPADHFMIAIFENNLGRCVAKLGRFEQAEPLLLGSQARLEARFGAGHDRPRKAAWRLAELYDAWGREDEAARWRAKIPAGYQDDR